MNPFSSDVTCWPLQEYTVLLGPFTSTTCSDRRDMSKTLYYYSVDYWTERDAGARQKSRYIVREREYYLWANSVGSMASEKRIKTGQEKDLFRWLKFYFPRHPWIFLFFHLLFQLKIQSIIISLTKKRNLNYILSFSIFSERGREPIESWLLSRPCLVSWEPKLSKYWRPFFL